MAGDRDLTLMLYENGTPELKAAVLQAASEEGIRHKVALARSSILDDHQPFLDAGIPAVDLIDFQYGSRPGLNDYWHTPADTLDKLSAESLTRVARIVARVVNGAALRAIPRPIP
jgi:Zn-dependent M28 family amino/carboxypeptidase